MTSILPGHRWIGVCDVNSDRVLREVELARAELLSVFGDDIADDVAVQVTRETNGVSVFAQWIPG